MGEVEEDSEDDYDDGDDDDDDEDDDDNDDDHADGDKIVYGSKEVPAPFLLPSPESSDYA